MSVYHDKNKNNCKNGMGFDYEAPEDKNIFSHRSKNLSKEKGPHILKNV